MALGTPVSAAAAYSASGGTTVQPAFPAGILTTDVVLLIVGQKPSTANGGTVTTPAGWTLREELTGAGGYGTTLGADTGNTNLRVYTWDAPVAGQTGVQPVTVAVNNVAWAFMVRVPTGGGAKSYGSADGQRTTTPTSPMSIALTNGATATNFQNGDLAIWAMCIPTDVTTPTQFSAQAITATGATFGTATEFNEPDSAVGNDIGGYSAWARVTAGSSTTAPTVTSTLAGTLTNVRGPVVLLRVREAAATVAITLDAQPTSYSITGSTATTTVTRHLVASPTSYAVTGQAALTALQRVLVASSGASSLTGAVASLGASRSLVAASGSYNVSGIDVTFIVTAAAGMDLQSGAFNITGAQATLSRTRVFNAETGAYVVTGSVAMLGKGVTLVASPANYTSAEYVDPGYVNSGYVGNDNPPAALIATRNLNLESGSFNTTGAAATLSYMQMLNASPGSYNLSGVPAALAYPYWPIPSQVIKGVAYGPNGDDYVGTFVDLSIKIDVQSGALIKPLSSKTAITL